MIKSQRPDYHHILILLAAAMVALSGCGLNGGEGISEGHVQKISF